MQELNQAEMTEVSGGLSVELGNNPIINGILDITPGGIFTLAGSLLNGALGLVTGLLSSVLGAVGGLNLL
jgi:hypothetical protein